MISLSIQGLKDTGTTDKICEPIALIGMVDPLDSLTTIQQQRIERATLLNAAAWETYYSNPNMARHLAEEARSLARHIQLSLNAEEPQELASTLVAQAWSLIIVSYCDTQQFDHEAALLSSHEALQLFEDMSDSRGQAVALLVISKVYSSKGEYRNAISTLKKALLTAERFGLLQQQRDIHLAISEAYEMQGQKSRALRYFKLFHQADRELSDDISAGSDKLASVVSLIEQLQQEKEQHLQRIEQLETEVHRRNQELAEMALNLVRKQELLDQFIKEVSAIMQTPVDNKEQMLNALKRDLISNANTELDWSLFQRQFVKVHPRFISALTVIYTDLTPTELKVCCLLKIGLSSKEIMQLMRVTIRVVEAHRYNIRRKLRLSTKQNLITFLAGL